MPELYRFAIFLQDLNYVSSFWAALEFVKLILFLFGRLVLIIVESSITLILFHIGEGGGADSTRLQIVFFITSVRNAAEPQNLVTFSNI